MSDLKAYHVQEDFESHCCIVFATNSATARRQGANELDAEWESVEFCRRAPWADQYAGRRGGVPPKAMIEQGWRISCDCCEQMIDNDAIYDPDEDDEENCNPVFVGNSVYFNVDHHDAEVAEIKARHELEQAVCDEALSKFPGVEVTWFFSGGRANIDPGVYMKVPGLQGRVKWHPGQDTVFVERRDTEAWAAYAASIKAAA